MKTLYTLVGTKHWNGDALVRTLKLGDDLLLVREPKNPHDPNAVQVWARSPASQIMAAVGYVGRGRAPGPKYAPGTENVDLAKHIDNAGAPPTALIPSYSLDAKFVPGNPPKIEVSGEIEE